MCVLVKPLAIAEVLWDNITRCKLTGVCVPDDMCAAPVLCYRSYGRKVIILAKKKGGSQKTREDEITVMTIGDRADEEYTAEEEYEQYEDDGTYDESSYDGYDETGYEQNEAEDEDSIIPEWMRPFTDKCSELYDRADEYLYEKYTERDERKLIEPKKALIIAAASAVALLLLGFFVIIFLGTFPYHTTGMKTKDFIREFNSMTSDTDIKAVLPDYVDVTIPKGTRFGKNNPLYLADGHVKMTISTRLGRIKDITVEGIDIPNFNYHSYGFKSDFSQDYDPANGQFYYYIALGKTAIAAQNLLLDGEMDEDALGGRTVSRTDDENGEPVPSTVYEAAIYGYQLYYYTYYYYCNRTNDGYLYVPIGKSYMDYTLTDQTLRIEPVLKKISNLPDGLQKFWDGLTGKNKVKEEEPVVDNTAAQVLPEPEQQPVTSDSVVSAS